MFHVWLDSIRFAAEVQQVVTSRLALIATADRRCAAETTRMVGEKTAAFAESQMATAAAIMTGQSLAVAMRRGFAPYRRRVRANSKRLRKQA